MLLVYSAGDDVRAHIEFFNPKQRLDETEDIHMA